MNSSGLHLVGVSHHLADLDARECFARSAPTPVVLVSSGQASEAVLVSTCNRHEILLVSRRFDEILGLIGRDHEAFVALSGENVVRHLYRVAASIDSMVVGEAQILGQIRAAEESATATGTIGPVLRRLFVEARRVGAAVRHHTGIGRGTVSIASVASRLARETLGDLEGKRLLLFGTGEIGRLVAEHCAASGAAITVVVHRNLARAMRLAETFRCATAPVGGIDAALAEAEIVVSATSHPGVVLTRDRIAKAMGIRQGRPLLLVDLAVPRDIEPSVAELDGVTLQNIDRLERIALEERSRRGDAIEAATGIVEEAVRAWRAIEKERQLAPLIRAGHERLLELEESLLAGLPDGPERRERRRKLRRVFHLSLEALRRGETSTFPARELFAGMYGVHGEH
jgi:glutamyl-tRNA reductase